MEQVLLLDLVVIIISATVLAFFAKLLKQPLIPAYVLAGVVVGPLGLKLISNSGTIQVLSELGIAFLLFIVGLEISFRRLRDIGKASAVIGVAQVLVMVAAGYLFAVWSGFNNIEALYAGIIIAFSSTMVVIKMLDDKNELDTLHGRLMLGILLVQDILVIVAMSVLINLDNLEPIIIATTLLKGLGLLAVAIMGSRYILPYLLKYVADSQELLFLSSLTWLFLFSGLAYLSGFSIAIGAFVAGVGLASFPYNFEIISRTRSLKDFFITIFFVSLGAELTFIPFRRFIVPTILLFGLVLILKPLVTDMLLKVYKYGARTAFMTSMGLAQISEFSLVLAAQGLVLAHISREFFSLVIIIAVATITFTSYFIKFERELFSAVHGFFTRAFDTEEKETHEREKLEELPKEMKRHIVVLGAHRMGNTIVQQLHKAKEHFVVVDFDPNVVKHYLSQGVNCMYGDAGDVEILERVNVAAARLVISTIPNQEDNMLLISTVRKQNPTALIFVVARQVEGALELYSKGADYVIVPRLLSGQDVASMVRTVKNSRSKLNKIKKEHIGKLEELEEEDIVEKYGPHFLIALRQKMREKSKGMFRF